ncbi:MAG TPA: hypothetical protein VHB30_10560 [Solirubrobacteraceae bacterium]|nr:hypothetical protein [Solirubrobacteraceae bacterium]
MRARRERLGQLLRRDRPEDDDRRRVGSGDPGGQLAPPAIAARAAGTAPWP